MSEQPQLKTCPFCGSSLSQFGRGINHRTGEVEMQYIHPEITLPNGEFCPLSLLVFTAAQFNHRPIEDALRAEAERSRAVVEAAKDDKLPLKLAALERYQKALNRITKTPFYAYADNEAAVKMANIAHAALSDAPEVDE